MLFVGRPEERKGLPVLLQAFEGLVEHVPAKLTVVGAGYDDVARYLAETDAEPHIEALGRVEHDELWRRLHEADVLCAPSLSGESFGMILTEAFAAGTPVIASNIAGYADVVTDGVDGVLVPPADAQRLAEELQALHHEPERRRAMGAAARQLGRALRVAARRRAGRRRLRAHALPLRLRSPAWPGFRGAPASFRSTAQRRSPRGACPRSIPRPRAVPVRAPGSPGGSGSASRRWSASG